MKITLKNFKCYAEKVFEFEDNMILISGSSGKGKTTILQAIYFALFGVGTKITSYGTTSCMVELEFKNIKVTRTKRPNRLLVNDKHLNDEGQAIIDEMFGKTFDTTGYIAQNAYKSFIMMSPLDKLAFLERFAFEDVDLSELKKKLKNMQKTRNDNLEFQQGQLELCEKVFNDIEKPESIPFPIKCSKKNREKVIKNERIKLKNNGVLTKRATKKLAELNVHRNDIVIYDTSLEDKNKDLELYKDTITDLEKELGKISLEDSEVIENYRDQLNFIVSNRELHQISQKFEDNKSNVELMKVRELEEMENECKEIDENLWKEYTKEELTETIKDCKDLLRDIQKIDRLKNERKQYYVDKSYKTKKSKLEKIKNMYKKVSKDVHTARMNMEVYKCPECKTSLKIKDGELHVQECNEVVEEDIETLEKNEAKLLTEMKNLEGELAIMENNKVKYAEYTEKIKALEETYDEICEYEEVNNDVENLRMYEKSQRDLEERKKKITEKIANKSFSTSIKILEKELRGMKSTISELKKDLQDCDVKHEEEFLRKEIEKYDKDFSLISEKEKMLKTYNRRFTDKKNEIEMMQDDFLYKYEEPKTRIEIEKEISEVTTQIKNYEIEREELEKTLEKIEEYLVYEKHNENYNEWKEKLDKSAKVEKESRNRYNAAMKLKEIILKAESMAIMNVIDSINDHAQVYLDDFFTDEPISVRLVPFKQTKDKVKPQVNIQIEYKGQDSGLENLSGGELSRVVLAFTLALAEMFNVPMIMLDECTASLDQELTTVVFDSIQEHFVNKTVVVVAHQVIEGTFDSVLKI